MKKDRVLRTVVILQGICMVVMAVVVVTRVLYPPLEQGVPGADSAGGNPGEGADTGKIAAVVGNERITEAQLAGALRSQYGDIVLHMLMVRAAVRQEASADSLKVTPQELEDELQTDMEGYESEQQYYAEMKEQLGLTPEAVREDAEYRLLLEKIATRDIQVSDSEIDNYISDNKDRFAAKTQYRLSWILSDNKRDAEDVLGKLEAGEDFALMAKTYSTDPDTAASGGDLGLVDAEDPFADREMLKAAAKLDIGEIYGPVAVKNGQAIIRLDEKRPTESVPEQERREIARREVALSKAGSLHDLEEDLLAKYKATTVK
jgi:foldase protein PrsA